MTKKDELIIGILKKELKHINKLLKDQEEQIENLKKNGFDSDVHPAHRIDIRTGLSYTQGYCTGHLVLAKNVIELLSMSNARDIEALIEENKRIEQENKKRLKAMYKELKIGLKKK